MIKFTMASGQTVTSNKYANVDEFSESLQAEVKEKGGGPLGAYGIWIPAGRGYICLANVCSYEDA